MPDLSDYWRGRAAQHGHTGWRDQVVYAYDQQERLRIVDGLLEHLGVPAGGVALDFGCGTGDFCRLLLDRGFEVFGYDPFVAPRLDHPRFRYLEDRAALERVPPVDLVLTVTVLDHILDENELDETLAQVHRLMRPGGRFAMLEYAIEPDTKTKRNGFQAFHDMDEWRTILSRHEFRLVESGPLPHPIDSPSEGFERFRRRLAVRALRRLNLADRRLGGLVLRQLACRSLAANPPRVPHPHPSPLRFMVCEP